MNFNGCARAAVPNTKLQKQFMVLLEAERMIKDETSDELVLFNEQIAEAKEICLL